MHNHFLRARKIHYCLHKAVVLEKRPYKHCFGLQECSKKLVQKNILNCWAWKRCPIHIEQIIKRGN
jgi:hypothetical protein